jgi:hypothetical protein
MTIADKRGMDNVIQSLGLVIGAAMPAKVAALNATSGPVCRAWLGGPFAFGSGNKTFIATINNAVTPITISTLTGTMSAAQVAAALVTTGLAAKVVLTNMVEIYSTTYGVAGSLKIGSGTGNAILGLIDNQVYNYWPLKNLAWIGPAYENVEGILPTWPALILRGESAKPQASNDMIMEYTIAARLRAIGNLSDFGGQLYTPLLEMAAMVSDVLRANSGLSGQVNVVQISDYRPSQNIDFGEGLQSAYVDFSLTVLVQEE